VLTADAVLAHLAPPVTPSALWSAWNWDPAVWTMLLAALVVHTRGSTVARRSGRHPWRRRAFLGALAVSALALLSPLDALSGSLAAAHMVQHLLLTIVVAPLLVLSAPTAALRLGLPHRLRADVDQVRRAVRVRPRHLVRAHPIATSAVFVAALWTWHAAGPYDLALRNDLVHRLEHAMFLLGAVASWWAIVAAIQRRGSPVGIAVLVLFALSVQGSVLGALLTFADAAWYPSYGDRAAAWGLSALEDQQLAGVIMWVPGGLGYLVAALAAIALVITRPVRSTRPARAVVT
jgi:putative membrane protein